MDKTRPRSSGSDIKHAGELSPGRIRRPTMARPGTAELVSTREGLKAPDPRNAGQNRLVGALPASDRERLAP